MLLLKRFVFLRRALCNRVQQISARIQMLVGTVCPFLIIRGTWWLRPCLIPPMTYDVWYRGSIYCFHTFLTSPPMLRLNLTSSLTLTLHVLLGRSKIRFLIPHEVSRPLYVSNRSHNPLRHRDAAVHKCLSQYQLRYHQQHNLYCISRRLSWMLNTQIWRETRRPLVPGVSLCFCRG